MQFDTVSWNMYTVHKQNKTAALNKIYQIILLISKFARENNNKNHSYFLEYFHSTFSSNIKSLKCNIFL